MIRAVIFDFDGLILETEGPSYQSWKETYQSFGFPLPFSTWSSIVGTTQGDFDPRRELQMLVDDRVDWEAVENQRQMYENELIEAQPVLPGVEQYLQDARRLNLKIGLASSSSCQWVTRHLTRLGLVDFFDCIMASDDVVRVKPSPELYLSVLRQLQVMADEAIALEDSPIGIHAAKSARIFCVAVPNAITRQLETSHADLHLHSLAELPLEELLRQIEVIKTQRAAV
jgi:HAD superfamily hydrolase (TIGR01509 family)